MYTKCSFGYQKLISYIANIAIQIHQIATLQIHQIATQCNKRKYACTWIPLSVLQSVQVLHFITIYSLRNSISFSFYITSIVIEYI